MKKSFELQKEKKIEKKCSLKPMSKSLSQRFPLEMEKQKKIFFSFVVFSILVLAGAAAYLFVPSAKIIVEPDFQTIKSDVSVHAGENVAVGDLSIPLRVFNKDESITLQYNASGKSQTSGQKAHGTVVISNSYSKDPQTLIATTRLQSESGKIFRLSKNVIVPGMTTVAGEIRPGAIIADVIADEAGSDYNIDPSSFKIPGFQGG